MNERNYYTPSEILEITVQSGIKKISNPLWKQFALGILAGVFIGLAASASNMAAYGFWSNPETYGLGKFVAGLVFPVGLMFVLIAGADLFTGNNLVFVGVLDKKVQLSKMFLNWILVYLGNFVGSLLIVLLVLYSGQLHGGDNMLAGATIKIAYAKCNLSFGPAVTLGVLCNFVVCLSVWMSYSAKDVTGKLLTAFFPILLFVISGFEHSVANMYYLPAGILAKMIPEYASASGLSSSALESINWWNMFITNLVPVTIGNIIGGSLLIGGVYWVCYSKRDR